MFYCNFYFTCERSFSLSTRRRREVEALVGDLIERS